MSRMPTLTEEAMEQVNDALLTKLESALGGIRPTPNRAPTLSLDWIYLRCKGDDCGCLLWQQRVNSSGAPTLSYRPTGQGTSTVQVRREVWKRKYGPIPKGMVVAVTCGRQRCLRHLELITRSEVNRRQWERPELRAKHTAATTKSSRLRAKANMEMARAIRDSNETLEVVSQKFGISVSLASLIRRGERWKESVVSPWSGLGA